MNYLRDLRKALTKLKQPGWGLHWLSKSATFIILGLRMNTVPDGTALP
jgi:hypothetical protein